MDQVSIGKFQNHRKNNKAKVILSDKRKGSNLALNNANFLFDKWRKPRKKG